MFNFVFLCFSEKGGREKLQFQAQGERLHRREQKVDSEEKQI